tara:strand:- start:34 stop:492 length:459 start_codon:yes stop_codon:yes gene_type:complete
MIKTIIKSIYAAFISIFIISIILFAWSAYAFVFQSSKSNEIIKVIQDMYLSQKSVVVDVIDLSKILIKDTSESISTENNYLFEETELITDQKENSQLDESPIDEDNGDNPLGIVIQPSLPEVGENSLPELIEEPLIMEQNDLSVNETDMNMN